MNTLPEIQTVDLQIDKTLLQVFEERQVIVHCHISTKEGLHARIWPTTYLFPHEGDEAIPLLHAENISYAPVWTKVYPYSRLTFTLIFGGLPKNCKSFDLIEVVNDGFFPLHADGILRSSNDVYHINI